MPIAYVLFFALSEYLAPAVNDFMRRFQFPSHPHTLDYDFASMVYGIIEDIELGIPYTRNLSDVLLRKAVQGRNCVCHLDFAAILTKWEDIFVTWISVCKSIGNERAAYNIQMVYNYLKKKQYRQIMGTRILRLPLGYYNENDAFGISQILYGCILTYMGPAIRNFISFKKQDGTPTSHDFFENLKKIIDRQRQDVDYLGVGGRSRNDKMMLEVSMTARNHCCHGHFTEVFQNWEHYVDAWLDLLHVIGAFDADAAMRSVYNTLMSCKTNHGSVCPAAAFF